jgi:hypothetical protein
MHYTTRYDKHKIGKKQTEFAALPIDNDFLARKGGHHCGDATKPLVNYHDKQ